MTQAGYLQDTIIGLWSMSRPLVMVSNVLVWLLGVSIASGSGYILEAKPVVFSFLAMLAVSASIHYTNEYADYETDALTKRTRYSGGSGVLPSRLVPRSLALKAAYVSLLSGLFLQFIAIYNKVHPWSAMALLILGALGGWMYSLPPLKIGWCGWGEVENALLGSNLLPFYGFVSVSGNLDFKVMLACLPVTLIAFNNLLAVTWPDRVADKHAGKMTLATLWTPKRLRFTYRVSLMASFTLLIILEGWIIPREIVLASVLALPLMIRGAYNYTHNKISIATIYGMVVMITAQTIAWFSIGLGYSL